jgi:hypothetical protein
MLPRGAEAEASVTGTMQSCGRRTKRRSTRTPGGATPLARLIPARVRLPQTICSDMALFTRPNDTWCSEDVLMDRSVAEYWASIVGWLQDHVPAAFERQGCRSIDEATNRFHSLAFCPLKGRA